LRWPAGNAVAFEPFSAAAGRPSRSALWTEKQEFGECLPRFCYRVRNDVAIRRNPLLLVVRISFQVDP